MTAQINTMSVSKRQCEKCKQFKGFQAFHKQTTTCKRCVQDTKQKLWQTSKIPSYRTCIRCDEKRHLFKDFSFGANGLIINICKKCKAKDLRIKNGIVYKPKCTTGFIMDGNKLCSKCDEVKPVKAFSGDKIRCKECDYQGSGERVYQQAVLNSKGEMQCKKCNYYKPLHLFNKRDGAMYTFGRMGVCKKCTYDRSKVLESEYKPIGRKEFIEKFNSMKDSIFLKV